MPAACWRVPAGSARAWAGPLGKVLDRIDAGLASGAIDAVLPDGSQRRLGGALPGSSPGGTAQLAPSKDWNGSRPPNNHCRAFQEILKTAGVTANLRLKKAMTSTPPAASSASNKKPRKASSKPLKTISPQGEVTLKAIFFSRTMHHQIA